MVKFLTKFYTVNLNPGDSINTTATSGGLPKVSYIKAMDIWFFACQIFTFISLIEYAQGSVSCTLVKNFRICHLYPLISGLMTFAKTPGKVNVYLRQQKLHDIEIEKAKLRGSDFYILNFANFSQAKISIEAKEKAALEEEDCWIYTLIGVAPPKPLVEKSIEDMVLVSCPKPCSSTRKSRREKNSSLAKYCMISSTSGLNFQFKLTVKTCGFNPCGKKTLEFEHLLLNFQVSMLNRVFRREKWPLPKIWMPSTDFSCQLFSASSQLFIGPTI